VRRRPEAKLCLQRTKSCLAETKSCLVETKSCLAGTKPCLAGTRLCLERTRLCAAGIRLCAAGMPLCLAGTPLCLAGMPLCLAGTPLCLEGTPLCLAGTPLCLAGMPLCLAGMPLCLAGMPLCLARMPLCLARMPLCLARTRLCLEQINPGRTALLIPAVGERWLVPGHRIVHRDEAAFPVVDQCRLLESPVPVRPPAIVDTPVLRSLFSGRQHGPEYVLEPVTRNTWHARFTSNLRGMYRGLRHRLPRQRAQPPESQTRVRPCGVEVKR
jgi:hypothetical protein